MRKRRRLLVREGRVSDISNSFTLILTFSRSNMVDIFFSAFNRMKIDMKNCHLLVFDNTDMEPLAARLAERVMEYAGHFRSVRLCKTYRRVGGDPVNAGDTGFRRSKLPMIYEMHLDMMKLLHTDKFVLIEDDTLPPPNAVMRLLQILDEYPGCGIATAIETGRSQLAYVKVRLGVHFVKRFGNKIFERISLNPKLRGLHSVDACGTYCCASFKNVWLQGLEGMNEYLYDIPRFALDVTQTNNVKMRGWNILADFSLWCEHMQSYQGNFISWGKRQAVPQLDIWLPEYQEYAQGVLLTKPCHTKMLRNLTRQRDRAWKKRL